MISATRVGRASDAAAAGSFPPTYVEADFPPQAAVASQPSFKQQAASDSPSRTPASGKRYEAAETGDSEVPLERIPGFLDGASPTVAGAIADKEGGLTGAPADPGSPKPESELEHLSASPDQRDHVRLGEALSIFLVCAVPMAVSVVVFSLMGFGLKLYPALARARSSTSPIGNLLVLSMAAWLAILFVMDAQRAPRWANILSGLLAVALLILAAVFKGMTYPWAAPLIVLLFSPGGLLWMRWQESYMSISRNKFYRVVGVMSLACSLGLLVAFIAWNFKSRYTPDGAKWNQVTRAQIVHDSADVYRYMQNEPLTYAAQCAPGILKNATAQIKKGCKHAETVWFVIWMEPFGAIVFGFIISGFCFLQSSLKTDTADGIISWLKQFIGFLVCGLFGMYVCIYAAGVSVFLASAFMALFCLTILALFLYAYSEIPPELVRELLRQTKEKKFGQYMQAAYESDWVRAMTVGAVNVLIPFLMAFDILRQQMRRIKGTSRTAGLFTEDGQHLVDGLRTWNWNSILTKVAILGELFGMSIFGGKFTYIFFSWLNGLLAGVNLVIIIVLVFLLCCVMFLNPVVPGTAMYLFAGIVIVQQGQDRIGFWGATIVASIVGLLSKGLFATCALWAIGAWLGKSIRVQKMIGVDTVGTRALEAILRKPGYGFGKIAILVGGPDWPTGVLCGLLRMSLLEVVIGSLPVFPLGIFPQTLVGALMTKGSTSGTIWSSITTGCTAVAVVAQVGSGLIATRETLRIIEVDGFELAKPREEHAAVAELTAKEAEFNQAYAHVEAWKELSTRRKWTVFVAAAFQLLAGFMFALDFVLMDPVCFAEFALNDTIEEALDGNAISVILVPVGVASLAVWFAGLCVHMAHSQDIARLAKKAIPAAHE